VANTFGSTSTNDTDPGFAQEATNFETAVSNSDVRQPPSDFREIYTEIKERAERHDLMIKDLQKKHDQIFDMCLDIRHKIQQIIDCQVN